MNVEYEVRRETKRDFFEVKLGETKVNYNEVFVLMACLIGTW